MKNICWTVAGLCAASLCVIAWGPKHTYTPSELAHRLELAWADHHTTV